MKNKTLILVLAYIFIICGLLTACKNPSGSGSTNSIQNDTVIFEANGGYPVPNNQIVNLGDMIYVPKAMTKTGYGFCGWYKEPACTNQWNFATDTVNQNITLYAKWESPIIVSGTSFNDKKTWLGNFAQSNNYYLIELTTNQSIDPTTFSYSGKNNITIELKGIGSNPIIINLNTDGSMFTIETDVSLILNNLELKGRPNNPFSLIMINSGGNLTINQGTKIIDNIFNSNTNGNLLTSINGGGVYNAGTFTMHNGEISGNNITNSPINYPSQLYVWGGGVYNSGTFFMTGGKICNNKVTSFSFFEASGGGVHSSGTFIISGGEIAGNSISSDGALGGGVYIGGGFKKKGGTIFGYTFGNSNSNIVKDYFGNIVQQCGHAVYVNHSYDHRMFTDTTSGPGDNLAFDASVNPPVWSGLWDN